jgi:acyl-CoA thioester hydrolase
MSTHKTLVRVYFSDTDAVGIVYHANYLDFAERARTEMCRNCGINLINLAKKGQFFVIRKASLNYFFPARLDDLLEVSATIIKFGRTSMEIKHEVTNKETGVKICEVDCLLVFVEIKNSITTPIAIPQEMKSCFI